MFKNPIPFVLAVALLAGGAAALIYQVTWQRYLAQIVGSDHLATATTLAVFLAGLSMGYALCGRWTLRIRRHFLTYGLLELAIAGWGLSFPFIFKGVEGVTASWSFAQPWALVIQSLCVAGILILPPTILMGATVPFLTRALATTGSTLTGTHAWVYGFNTAGAVAGALVAAFHLLPFHGLRGSLLTAAAMNLLAAIPFLLLGLRRWTPEIIPAVAEAERPATARYSTVDLRLLALLSGLAVMCQENALIRLGSLVLGGTSYVLAMIISVFVAAIALGSLYVSRMRRIPSQMLWRVTTLAAWWWLLVYLTVDLWPYYAHLLRIGVQGSQVGFYLFHTLVWLAFIIVLGPAAAWMGTVLPLVFHEYRSSVEDAGHSSGGLLAWNAAGALLGSLAGGLLLFYVMDLGRALVVGPLMAVGMCLVTMRHASTRGRVATWALAGIGLLIFVFQPLHDPSRLAMGTFRHREPVRGSFDGPDRFHEERFRSRKLVAQADGPLASVSVFEAPVLNIPGLTSPREIFINGKSESNTKIDAITVRASAHLPALLAPKRERVLIVGLGTGVTAGEFLLYPDVQQIDVAEISPSVVEMLPHFAAHTRSVHEDPRFRARLEDVRLLLRRPGESWNLIVSEPSNLWVSGIDSLFTEQFFRTVEARLEPGGLFLQWVHLYDADLEMVRIICNTLHEVFPHLRAYLGTQGDVLVVASRDPLGEEAMNRAAEQWEQLPEVQASMAEMGIASLDDLLQRELTSFPRFLKQAKVAGTHTVGDTHLSHLAGRAIFRGAGVGPHEIAALPEGR